MLRHPLLLSVLLLGPALGHAADPLGSTIGGALSGAIIGGIIDGDDGAATGAAIGAGVGLMRGTMAGAPERQAQRDFEAMQQAQHDAMFAEAQRMEIATLAPPPPPVPTETVPELPAYSSPTLRKIQQALTESGHYRGPVDGYKSDATTDAIKAYQTEQGLPVNGRGTMALLNHLNSD